jgi:two-component system, NarL family, sensor histidine kinase UhpB
VPANLGMKNHFIAWEDPMKDLFKILLLEDNAHDAEDIMRRLQTNEKFDCEFRLATGKDAYLQALEEFSPSIVLFDHSLPQFDSKEALAIARGRFPDIPFIMVTGSISEEYAINMIKTGVDDYILMDKMTRLPTAILASVQKRQAEKEKKMREQEREFDRNNLKALINNTNDLMWSVDRNFKLIISNDAFDRMIGTMTGKTVERGGIILSEGFNWEQLGRFHKYYERAFSGEGFTVVEYADLRGGRWSEISFYPIYNGDAVSGATCFSRDITHRKIAEKEIADLEQEIINQKIQEQRKIARAILKAQEKERNYLGQELHDNVNQILAATKMMLSVALSVPEKCPELVLDCQKNIEDAMEENRKIAQGLVVPDFESIPFKEQLNHLTDSMLKKAGIYVVMDISGFQDELMDDDQRLAIYRVAQEQYTNIIKHAAAGFVYILLSTLGDHFKMLIFDNGKGQAAGTKTAGIGLRNIKGRVGLFNGTATAEASPERGFTLEIVIPLTRTTGINGTIAIDI